MGKAKPNSVATHNGDILTIRNWVKIGVGINNANTMEGESFYAVRIGMLGAVIVHREIDEDRCVIVEIGNHEGDKSVRRKVWIGSIVLSEPAPLLDYFMDNIIKEGWI